MAQQTRQVVSSEPNRVGGEPDDGIFELADETPEALLRWCDEMGWGDGLPVVAPTAERVQEMLGPDQSRAGECIGVLPPRMGRATWRVLAANAVMAGCPPGHLPVLAAAVRALSHEDMNLRGVNATTHPVAPLVIVHGQAGDDLNFNAEAGTFGPGCRANASLGRALRLVLLQVAGARPGAGDASTQGGPAKYAYCIAENARANPWESYAKHCGVVSDSAVTVTCGEAPHNFHDMERKADPGRILDKAASVMATLGSNNAPISTAEFFVVLGPEHATTIAGEGWSRRDVQSYLFERARLPVRLFRQAFENMALRPWEHALPEDAAKPMVSHPDQIRVLVAGGAGKHSSVIPSWGMTRSVCMAV